MTAAPPQLLLLADHVKLSLLELERGGQSSGATKKQDAAVGRSLVTLRDGIAALERQRFEAEAAGEDITDLADQVSRLNTSLLELDATYQSIRPAPTSPPTSATPKSNSQRTRPSAPRSSSLRGTGPRSPSNKAVRFRDDPSQTEPTYRDTSPDDTASRAALFKSNAPSTRRTPARISDTPENVSGAADDEPNVPQQHSNQQIHAHHTRVLAEQDEQLDRLGSSVGRQRELSIAMGNELDDQALLLEDVERGVDRHQGALDRARDRLGKFSRRAKDNWSWVTIGCLLLVLVLLIILVK